MSNDKIKYGTVEVPDDAFNDENAMVPLKVHNRSRAKVRTLMIANRHLVKAVGFALDEFERISYQKKADPKVIEFLKTVLNKVGRTW